MLFEKNHTISLFDRTNAFSLDYFVTWISNETIYRFIFRLIRCLFKEFIKYSLILSLQNR